MPISPNRFALPAAVLLAALLLGPAIGMIGQVLSVLALFPLIVHLGAGSKVGSRLGSTCLWLGRLSYPLYVLHHPILRVVSNAAQKLHFANTPAIAAASAALSIGASWAAMGLYDEPVRRWLKSKLLRRPEPEALRQAA